MRNMILVLDESGEKQYSSKHESRPYEFGIMAGVFLTEVGMNALSDSCNDLFSPYSQFFPSGKRHITDLEPNIAHALRKDVISLFKGCGLPWFYEAIYSQGFHEHFHDESRLGHMTYGGDKKHLLHAELFRGMAHKSIDILAQGGTEAAHIKVITDTVDISILKKFDAEAEDLVGIWMEKEKVETFSGYDHQKNKVHTMKISSSMSLEEIPKFDSLSYEIHCDDSDLTFLTDILVGMTRYYIHKSYEGSDHVEINSKAALSDHPLRDLVVTCGPEGQFTDRLYRRKKNLTQLRQTKPVTRSISNSYSF